MDALGISEIVMNSDSEDSDLDDSCSDFDDDLNLITSDSETDRHPTLLQRVWCSPARSQQRWSRGHKAEAKAKDTKKSEAKDRNA